MSFTHLEDIRPRARKEHQCYLCERPIAVGEVHVKRCGVNDDGLSMIRMHLDCEAASREWDWYCWEEAVDAKTFREEELPEFLERRRRSNLLGMMEASFERNRAGYEYLKESESRP